MAIVRVEKRENDFVQIDNTVLEDDRISMKAKGIAAYLLSKPDNWEANSRHLSTIGPDGDTAMRSGLKELEEVGYLTRNRKRNEDGTFAWEIVLYERPKQVPEGDNPCVENPRMDKPRPDNRGNNNTIENNTRTNNNKQSVPADAGPAPEVEDDAPVKESETEPEQKREPTDHQKFFGAVCECVGWDYQTLTKNQKGRVAQTLGVLKRADYTIDDLRTFYRWWFDDHWIGKKKGDHPTLNQLRAEIGKMKAKGESRNGKPWSRRSQKRSGRQAEPERDENGDTEADRIRRNLYGDEIAEQYRGMS